MKNKLLWKMFLLIGVGTVIFFWVIDIVTQQTETKMSHIDLKYQEEIIAYGRQAEALYLAGDEAALLQWLNDLEERENTWAAVVQGIVTPLAGSEISPQYMERFRLGRHVEWQIHLYFPNNPTMEVTFLEADASLLIQLPQRMRPGGYYPHANIVLQVALPFIVLCLLALVLYRHVMRPLQKLERVTQKFSEGDYKVRAGSLMGKRNDEIASLAHAFDGMATRIGNLITIQRELLENLSHELRTPLSRLDLAVEHIQQESKSEANIERLRNESSVMREMVEDTLMLVWLSNETPQPQSESFDLIDLLDVICEDARFEYPQHSVSLHSPEQAPIANSNHRSLAQAIENIVRNGLQHTPEGKQVTVTLSQRDTSYCIQIDDQGPGVPDAMLNNIFKPFFQVDSATNKKRELLPIAEGKRQKGFGLGLALAQRQISMIGGSIKATNIYQEEKIQGLRISLVLPIDSKLEHAAHTREAALT